MVLQFLLNGIVNGSLIAITALGFSLIYNTTRIFHIAYAGIYIWSGYLLYAGIEYFQIPFIPALLLALAGAALLSLACDALVYTPLIQRKRSHNALMISSVGVLILLVSLVELIFGNTPGFIHFDLSDHVNTASVYISGNRLMSLLLSMLVIVVFFVYLKYTSVGIRIRALRDNELLGRVFGMRTGRLQSGLFALSGIFAGLASCLSAIDVGVNPQLGIPVFINAFVALVIGGTGRFDGPVLGGLMLGLLQALTEYFFDSKWVMMVTFMMLILFLLVRPQGLIPEKTRTF